MSLRIEVNRAQRNSNGWLHSRMPVPSVPFYEYCIHHQELYMVTLASMGEQFTDLVRVSPIGPVSDVTPLDRDGRPNSRGRQIKTYRNPTDFGTTLPMKNLEKPELSVEDFEFLYRWWFLWGEAMERSHLMAQWAKNHDGKHGKLIRSQSDVMNQMYREVFEPWGIEKEGTWKYSYWLRVNDHPFSMTATAVLELMRMFGLTDWEQPEVLDEKVLRWRDDEPVFKHPVYVCTNLTKSGCARDAWQERRVDWTGFLDTLHGM